MARPGPEVTNMDEPLSIGMLGYRFMGKAHSNALHRLPMFFPDAPDVDLSVLIGRQEDELEAAAERFGFSRTATDWEGVVDDIDILYNLGPNALHVEPSIAALDAGVSVFCEKPLAHTLSGAERMRDAAERSSAVAGVTFNYRFIPAVQYAKELIESGKLGDIRHVRGHYLQDWLVDSNTPWSWRLDEEIAGSGALGDLGSHVFDLVGFLVGERAGEITRVSGNLHTFVSERPAPDGAGTKPVTVDDAVTAQAEFESGAMGTVEASRYATGHTNDLGVTINGSEGSLRFSLEHLNELQYCGPDDRGYQTILVTDESDPYLDHWWPPGHVLGWEHTFVHANYEFLTAVADDSDYDPSFGDGYRVQEILAAVERSEKRGEWVETV